MQATLPRRALLGAELPGDHDAFTSEGVRIVAVAPESMAARAGLGAGDVLVSLAGMPVRDLRELAAALRRAGAATTTELAFVRGGEHHVGVVAVVPFPREPDAVYGELAVAGAALRTIETTPTAPRALVVL